MPGYNASACHKSMGQVFNKRGRFMYVAYTEKVDGRTHDGDSKHICLVFIQDTLTV